MDLSKLSINERKEQQLMLYDGGDGDTAAKSEEKALGKQVFPRCTIGVSNGTMLWPWSWPLMYFKLNCMPISLYIFVSPILL